MTRKLAYIAKIEEIIAIEGADRIVQYRVLGWKVIDQKDKYQVGDLVVYVEADAWMPHTLAPFLTKPGHFPKTYNGIEGQRLKTIKLRGQISQGILLKIADCFDVVEVEGVKKINTACKPSELKDENANLSNTQQNQQQAVHR